MHTDGSHSFNLECSMYKVVWCFWYITYVMFNVNCAICDMHVHCNVQQFAKDIFCAGGNLRLQRLDSDGSDSYICPPPPPSL